MFFIQEVKILKGLNLILFSILKMRWALMILMQLLCLWRLVGDFFRQRLETGDRDADIQQCRAFQKLIYVSKLVFGEASSFLLPWKRVFKVTDSQVEIAIDDSAQRLSASKLKLVGRDINVEQLFKLREAQHLYRLSDEHAADLFMEHTRKLVEENISAALNLLKARTRAVRGVAQFVEELDKMLELNDFLISLKNHQDVALPLGLVQCLYWVVNMTVIGR